MNTVRVVESTTEARTALPGHLKEFSEKGAQAAPVFIGRHRKPEAVLISYDLFEKVLQKELLAHEVRSVLTRVVGHMELENQGISSSEIEDIYRELLLEESPDEATER